MSKKILTQFVQFVIVAKKFTVKRRDCPFVCPHDVHDVHDVTTYPHILRGSVVCAWPPMGWEELGAKRYHQMKVVGEILPAKDFRRNTPWISPSKLLCKTISTISRPCSWGFHVEVA